MCHDWTFRADRTAPMRARHAVVARARELGVAGGVLTDVALAVSEAVANAVVHAYDGDGEGDVAVTVELIDGALRVVVRDFGVGMQPRYDSPGLGLGLPLIAHASLDVDVVAPPEGGTIVSMRFGRRR